MNSTTDINVRADWDAALAKHRNAVAAMDPSFVSDEATDAACDAEAAAWYSLIDTPAPDVEALAIKLTAALDVFAEGPGKPTDPAFLTQLLDQSGSVGGFPLVRVLQDALRIAGIPSPILQAQPTPAA